MLSWLAGSALMQSPLGPLLKRFWKPLLVGLALVCAFLWHQHAAHKALTDAYARGKADEAAHVLKQAEAQKKAIDALTGKISTAIRTRTDAQIVHIHDAAAAVRVQGPGRAVCPRPSAASSGSQPAGGASGAAVDQVPDAGGQLIA